MLLYHKILHYIEKNSLRNSMLKKYCPLLIMNFLIVFSDRLLCNAKDALFVTAPGSGAESLAFLKMWASLPCMIGVSVLYVTLRQYASFKKSYYIILSFFITFFLLFNIMLYPYVDVMHWSLDSMIALQKAYPRIQHAIPVVGNWTFSIYHIFCELWSMICMTILVWQFANDTASTSEAKVIYPFIAIMTNIASVSAAGVMSQLSLYGSYIIIIYSNYIVIVSAICSIFAFTRAHNTLFQDIPHRASSPGDHIRQPSFIDSVYKAWQSPYMCFIAMLVMSYSVLMSIFEQTWKSQVKELHPSLESYYAFMADYFFWLGIISTVCILWSKDIVGRKQWYTLASLTPLFMTVVGVLFFSYVFLKHELHVILMYMGATNPLQCIVYFSTCGVLLSRCCKNSFFMPSKEMALILVDHDLKVTGKALTDGASDRIGQSSGGIIQQILLIYTVGNQASIAPYLGFIVVCIGGVWVFSVRYLSQLYERRLALEQ